MSKSTKGDVQFTRVPIRFLADAMCITGGPGVDSETFWVGDEVGNVYMCRFDGCNETVFEADEGDEAVNSLAFSDGWLAIGSRKEMKVISLINEKVEGGVIDVGVHDIVSWVGGRFYAAAGRLGVVATRFDEGGSTGSTIIHSNEDLYAYKLHVTANSRVGPTIAVAGRMKGQAVLKPLEGKLSQHTSLSVRQVNRDDGSYADIVSVCGLSGATKAYVLLSRDGKLITSSGAKYTTPLPYAYKVIRIGRHLAVQGKHSIQVYHGLATVFSNYDSQAVATSTFAMPSGVIDIAAVHGRWLMAVTDDGEIWRLDVSRLS